MDFLKKFFNLIGSPSHSRTITILVSFTILAAIPLTVYVAQQQQQLKQRAAGNNCAVTFDWASAASQSPLNDGNNPVESYYSLKITKKPISSTIPASITLDKSITTYNALDQPQGNYNAHICSGFNTSTNKRVNCINVVGSIACATSVVPTATPAPTVTFTPISASTPTLTQTPAVTSIPIPTAIATTSAPINSVTLTLALNAQDALLTEENLITVKLSLYNQTTNASVSGAPASKAFSKAPTIPGKKYSANVSLTNLLRDKYFIVARKDNMIAKSIFTVSSTNGAITVPVKTLVFGDVNNDDEINISDYFSQNGLRDCIYKITSIDVNPACLPSDFNTDGIVDQIDYNTWLRGFVTWNKEGKEE